MIEVDGKAIPLEPGQLYLILIEEILDDDDCARLTKRLKAAGINGVVWPVRDVRNVRVIAVERPETPLTVTVKPNEAA